MGLFKLKDEDGNYNDNKLLALGGLVFLGIVLLILFWPLSIIRSGEEGIKLTWGALSEETLSEGLHFRLPIAQRIIKMNVQVQKSEVDASAASRDLQTVTATVALNWAMQRDMVDNIYKEYQLDYESRLIAPTIQESVKSATAQFTADELITKRAEVRDLIKLNLKEKLEPRGFIVDEFNIVNFDFSESFNNAIEQKVTAEQEALAAKNTLEKVKFEAEQEIEKAKGRAEALRIEGDALRQNSQLIELRAIEKWNGTLPTMTGGAIPFINVTQ